MKKILIIIISVCILPMLAGCLKRNTTYEVITYSQLQEMEKGEKTFPLVIGSSTCSACSMYKVTMEAFIKKNNLLIYFIDLDELTDEEKEQLRVETNYESTPTTVFYENGKLLPSYVNLVGSVDTETITKAFISRKYIK